MRSCSSGVLDQKSSRGVPNSALLTLSGLCRRGGWGGSLLDLFGEDVVQFRRQPDYFVRVQFLADRDAEVTNALIEVHRRSLVNHQIAQETVAQDGARRRDV
jgi:hypothetical protein